tara:strand:- start:9966 stop:10469 length:504 start_codon:yes stop_codon:yes gene_type:complete
MNYEQSIKDWIENFLCKENPAFNNLPACPFAKQAMLDNKITYCELQPIQIPMFDYFVAELENFSYHWPKGKEVVVIGTKPQFISAEELSLAVESATTRFLYSRGYIALEDHPDAEEKVLDVCVNQGEYALVLLQERDKLQRARNILQKQDYYKYWTPEYYEEVVNDM